MLTIGVDIGGTKVAAGVVDETGAVLARGRTTRFRQDPTADVDHARRDLRPADVDADREAAA